MVLNQWMPRAGTIDVCTQTGEFISVVLIFSDDSLRVGHAGGLSRMPPRRLCSGLGRALKEK
jgi:hypothetical protein